MANNIQGAAVGSCLWCSFTTMLTRGNHWYWSEVYASKQRSLSGEFAQALSFLSFLHCKHAERKQVKKEKGIFQEVAAQEEGGARRMAGKQWHTNTSVPANSCFACTYVSSVQVQTLITKASTQVVVWLWRECILHVPAKDSKVWGRQCLQ